MTKFLKRVFNSVFNSVIFNRSIAVFFFVIAILVKLNKIPILKKIQAIDQYKVFIAMLLICSFFIFNSMLIFKNKHTYLSFFTFISIWAVVFFVVILYVLIESLRFTLKYEIPEKNSLRSFLYFVAISYTALVWCVYLNFCIRVLISINIKCSVFVAITVKAILIAIVAWLALYKDSGTDNIISFTASYISLCYPIIDMYKYVRLELDKYMKDNNNPIKIKSHSD